MHTLETRRFFTPSGFELKHLKPCIRMIDPELVTRQTGRKFTREDRDRSGWVWRCAVPKLGGAGLGRTPAEAYERWEAARHASVFSHG